MPYDVPAGIAAFGGGLASGPGANNPFNNVFGSVAGGYTPDRSFEKVVRVMELERALSADRRRQEQERKALEEAAELRQLMGTEDLRQLFDVDQKTAISRRFPAAQDPTSLQQNLGAAGLRPGTPEFQAAMLKAINKPQVQINQPSLPPGFYAQDPNDLSQGVLPIPGSPQDPSSPTTQQRNVAAKAKQTFTAVNKQLDDYKALLEKHGSEVIPGKARDELSTRQTQLLLDLKELNNLGVLNGPDLEIMERLLIDPTAPTNLIKDTFSFLTGGASIGERAQANVEVIRQQARDKMLSQQPQLPQPQQPQTLDIPVEQLQNLSVEQLMQLKQEMMNAGQP